MGGGKSHNLAQILDSKILSADSHIQGILIEPDSNVFQKLLKNRPNPSIAKYNLAIYTHEGELEFMQISGYAQMLSGVISEYNHRHLERIKREIAEFGGSYEVLKLPCAKLQSILAKHNMRHIDYLSIDVEGGEEAILKSIDFKAVDIALLGVENNYNNATIHALLTRNGFKKIARLGCDEFYAKNSPFCVNP